MVEVLPPLKDPVPGSSGMNFPRRTKQEGNIGSVFASFSGGDQDLPKEYARFKRDIISTPELEEAIVSAWTDLLQTLETEIEEIKRRGSLVIPDVDFSRLASLTPEEKDGIRRRGCLVIRNVVDEAQARRWEDMLKAYVKANPVQGFPPNDPVVFELYWSKTQMQARSHPHFLKAQTFLNGLWNTNSDPTYPVDLNNVMSYADRCRIRKPGDKQFNLGPHCDAGSIELWEDEGYRRCYAPIWKGKWRHYDPYDAALRDQTSTNLHNATAYCGVMRTWQGWLALANIGPREGTILNLPLVKEATAYFILRPFFAPISPPPNGDYTSPTYLAPSNWRLDLDSSTYPGSIITKTQEFSPATHPHLRLSESLVSMPKVNPGDYVAWHCEGIHAVDPEHCGKVDSTILYISSCILTPKNLRHLAEQRLCFDARESGPDMPAGKGEGSFADVGGEEDIISEEGRRAMGLSPFLLSEGSTEGAKEIVEEANRMLFGST